jgi:hypothetical protein
MRWCKQCGRTIPDEHNVLRVFGAKNPIIVKDDPGLKGKGRRIYECPVTLVFGDDLTPTPLWERVTELNNRYVHNDRLEAA